GPSLNSRRRARDMPAGDGEVAPLAVQLDGCLRMWRARKAPSQATGNGAPHQDMDAAAAGGVLRIGVKATEPALCPGVQAAISLHTMVQVDAGIVVAEHVPQAIIAGGTPAPLSFGLGVAGPGRCVVGAGQCPGAWVVGHLGGLAAACLSTPADPL